MCLMAWWFSGMKNKKRGIDYKRPGSYYPVFFVSHIHVIFLKIIILTFN